jgi:DNA repair exonuclease SbcCD ATPase subunit
MYYVKNIKAENLFSWKELNLSFRPNTTYSFKGKNGSGKSSIFEMITWILWKKTTKKNVKGNFGKDDGEGTIKISDGKDTFKVIRYTEMPATVLVNGKPVEQDYIDQWLGSYSAFMAANMCSQKRVASFINESSDSGKAKIFGEMIGCGILDKIRSKVQTKRNVLQVDYEAAKAKVESAEESIEEAEAQFEGMDAEEFEESIAEDKVEVKELKDKIKELKEEYDKALAEEKKWNRYFDVMNDVARLHAQITATEKDVKKFEKKLKTFKVSKLEDEVRDAEGEVEEINGRVMKYNTQKRMYQSQVSELQTIIVMEGDCPTCGRPVTEKHREHVKEKIDGLKRKIQRCEKNSMIVQKKLGVASAKKKELIANLNEAEHCATSLRIKTGSLGDLKKHYKIVKKNLVKPEGKQPEPSILKEQLDSNNRKSVELSKGIEYKGKILQACNKAKDRLKQAQETLKKKDKIYTVYKWLFDNLPIMKLRYINDNKLALEDVINENISSMGIPFLVKIETQKELKSTKEVKDSFSFQILSTVRKRKADRKDLSGGEETCILLATQFGIGDIVGTNLDFEIYDEVYGSLDDTNLAHVVDSLKDRSDRKQIFTVSHKPEISHSFDNVIEVENVDGYSKARRT